MRLRHKTSRAPRPAYEGLGGLDSKKVARHSEALALARAGAAVLVWNDQLGWLAGGHGSLARFETAHNANPLSCWIYGVAR